MQAILYVAHGSRVKAGIDEALRFIHKVKSTSSCPYSRRKFSRVSGTYHFTRGCTMCAARRY